MSTNTINNVPLNGRNWVFVAQLAAGVAPASGLTRGSGTGDFYANGQLAVQNNFVLDGVDDNANIADLMNASSFIIRPPPDALSEFSVDTANYSAEFGHSAGAVVNASLKSGTNQIHGDLWEYVRNNDFDARDFDALTIPPYHENQFGATLGFPLVKGRLFYFGDAEANRIVYATPTTVTVPTALMRQGNFSELLNTSLTGSAKPTLLYEPNSGGTSLLSCNGQQNVFCPSQIDTVAQNILSLYPAPNTNSGRTYNNYNVNLPGYSDTWQWDQRIDWNLSSKDLFYTRYSYVNVPAYIGPPLGRTLDGSTGFNSGYTPGFGQGFMLSATHIFNPALSDELRFGYNWGKYSYLPVNYNTDLAPTLGLGGIPYGPGFAFNGGLPYVTISGLAGFGTSTYDPSVEGQNVYEILDNVTKTAGAHLIKLGIQVESVRISALQPVESHGSYTFSGLYTSDLNASFTGYGVADFLADQMHAAAISNSSEFNDSRWYQAGYAQDDWQVRRTLTLNIGIRYDFYQTFKENAGRQAMFSVTGPLSPGAGSGVFQIPVQSQSVALSPTFTTLLAANNISLQYVHNPRLVNAQYTNFSPRFGFAYSAIPNMVIRGGFGTFYGGLQSIGVSQNLGENYPFEFADSFAAPSCKALNCPSVGITLENGFSSQLSTGLQNFISLPTLKGSDQTADTPYTIDYNLAVQQAFGDNLVATLAYVGNEGRHLVANVLRNSSEALLNPANSTQSVLPFPGFAAGGSTYLYYSGVSTYNAFQATLQKRLSGNLSFLATYTWSHSLDDAQGLLGPVTAIGGSNAYRNPNMIPIIDDYSNSTYDTRQRVTFNGFYKLPFGPGQPHANGNGIVDRSISGWATNLTFTAEAGQPISVSPNTTTAAGGTAHALLTGNPFAPGGSPNATNPTVTCATQTRTLTNWYNPCAFSNPLPGSDIPATGAGSQVTGTTEAIAYLGGRRSQITGPGYERIDMSLFKDFTTFRERYFQFRADIFNVLNTPAYGDPSVTTDNPSGGQITSARQFANFTPNARFFQFALKYVF
jgi:hypothetical protein